MSKESLPPFRAVLVDFYQKYNPSCVHSVDAIIETYRGREDELMKALNQKYCGVVEPLPRKPVQSLESLAKPSEERTEKAEATTDEKWRRFLPRHPSNEVTYPAVTKQQVFHVPHSSVHISVPHESKDVTRREAEGSWTHQAQEYPQGQSTRNVPPRKSSQAEALAHVELKARLIPFYRHYNPSMLPFVDEVVSSCTHEDDLIKDLTKKYGPEPARDSKIPVMRMPPVPLRSPSPPEHLRRAQETLDTNKLSSTLVEPLHPNSPGGAQQKLQGAKITQLEDVIVKLSHALEVKTCELEALQVEAHHEAQQLRTSCDQKDTSLSDMTKQLSLLKESLGQKATHIVSLQKLHSAQESKCQELTAQLGSSLPQLTKMQEDCKKAAAEHERVKSSLAVREHQNRMLRTQYEQLFSEIAVKEDQTKNFSAQIKSDQERIHALLEDLSSVHLEVVPPSNPERFYSVVEEIQLRFREHYEQRAQLVDEELRHYYDYAKQQIANRDAVIDELTQKIASDSSAAISAAGEKAISALDQGDSVLAQEVARLQVQLNVQTEEYKAVSQAVQHRRSQFSGLQPPVPQVVDASALLQLKEELSMQKAEAVAAKSALNAELGRQADELNGMHSSLSQFEADRASMEDRITILSAEAQHWKQEASRAYGSSNEQWSHMYEAT